MNKTIFRISILFISTGLINSAYGLNPDKEYILTPDSVGWSYEELQISTADDFKLNTWIYSANPETDKNTVLILAYPDAGNMSYFVYHAATLANAGFTVVTFDYRGFGKSTNFEINPSYLYYTEFCKDLTAVVSEVSSKFENHEIGIWAMSMGTTITARSFQTIKSEIDFIVGEGFVTDTARIVTRIKSQKNKDIILPEPSSLFAASVTAIDVPVLIFSGSGDTVTTTSDAHELKEKLENKCEVVEYEGGHLRGFQAWSDKAFGQGYIEQINLFLKKS